MRTPLALALSLVAAGGGATAVAGCGADDAKEAVGLDVAKAAAATAQQKTARVTQKVTVKGLGLPLPLDVNATGVTSLESPEGKLTFDFGPLLALAGAPAGGSGKVETRFTGGTIYAKPPKLDGLTVPGGKPWVALRLPKLAAAVGLPTRGLGKLFSLDASSQLRALKAAKGLKRVGEEQVDGAKTTHYRGTFSFADLVKTLPPADQADVKAALAKLERLAKGSSAGFDQPVPTELWVDGDGVARRVQSTTKLPAQAGTPGGTVQQTSTLSDFGTPLDAAPPAAGETYDATDAAANALRSLSAAGGSGVTKG